MSTAPDIATLLDFEGNIEGTVQAYLAGLYPGTQILTHQSTITAQPKLLAPRMEVELLVTGTKPTESARGTDGKVYRSYKSGVLNFRCWSRRNAGAPTLGTLRGQVREAMLESSDVFNDTACPWYAVTWFEEHSSRAAIEASNDEIMTELVYDIYWWVQPDAWPAS